MNLFEFLMILLSLIVGLGLAEILSGVARHLKRDGLRAFSWTHSAISAIVFIGLLQTFWESWSLQSVPTWTFPAMLLMLGAPVTLFLIAHVIFPEEIEKSLDEHYFERTRLLWVLGGLTVVVGALFRPLAFDEPLWTLDNVSAIPTLAVCILLGAISARLLHRVLVPLVLLMVLLDILAINYSIG
jgi:hypothetical protein